jgi:hypothetical protein
MGLELAEAPGLPSWLPGGYNNTVLGDAGGGGAFALTFVADAGSAWG